ncbi:hypothetical protein FACS189437_02560 [Bacteroidia bacterium]|nr:hypothetical protein FACS189437_02560 [Bacteroidia bacterium]
MEVKTIGRSSQNNIVINDKKVSRHHLQIIQDDQGNFRLADFGSLNGTYVNGRKVTGEVPLSPKDVVVIGHTTLSWLPYFPPPIINDKQRHDFVTVWFCLMILWYFVSAIRAIVSYNQINGMISGYKSLGGGLLAGSMDNLFSSVTAPLVVAIVGSIFGIIFTILLFKWKKLGFWGLVGSNVLFAIFSMYLVNQVTSFALGGYASGVASIFIAIPVLNTIILWAVLQIKKNGVSCWELLK